MKTPQFIRRSGSLVVAALLTSTTIASAVTWDGDTSANWSDAGNWDVPPVNGDNLTFSGTGNQTNVNDAGITSINTLTLSNGGWDIDLGASTVVVNGIVATDSSSISGTVNMTNASSRTITLDGTSSTFAVEKLILGRVNNFSTLNVNGAGNLLSLGSLQLTNGGGGNNSRTINAVANVTVSGNVTQSGNMPSVTKTGSGSLTFNGTCTYTGATNVDDGTLLINGDSSLATGAVTVNNTASLGGSGTTGGDVTIAAEANLAPGGTVDNTLEVLGGLDISAMAGDIGTLQFELGSIAASDKITVGGALTIGSGTLNFADFAFTDVGGLQNGTYTLIQGSSSPVGSLDATPGSLTGTIGGGPATGTLQIDGNDIKLVVSGVGGGGNDFSDWIGGFSGLNGLTGVNDDADGDGIDNGVENFFGTLPNAFSQGLVPVSADTGANTFTFSHPLNDTLADDLTATYRWSTDLTTFHDDGASNGGGTTTVSFAPGTPSGGMVTVVATITGTEIPSQLFVRVEVSQN